MKGAVGVIAFIFASTIIAALVLTGPVGKQNGPVELVVRYVICVAKFDFFSFPSSKKDANFSHNFTHSSGGRACCQGVQLGEGEHPAHIMAQHLRK
jgi:hypothetical protein